MTVLPVGSEEWLDQLSKSVTRNLRAPSAVVATNPTSGFWRATVRSSNGITGQSWDVTQFRGAMTKVTNLSTTDPFGPAAATIQFPAITLLDRPGEGDLSWLIPEADVDLEWTEPLGVTPSGQKLFQVRYAWEGFLTSMEYGEDEASSTLNLGLTGALRQVDNYLAVPEYVAQPLPYERAIIRQFSGRPDLRVAAPRVEWPESWGTRFARGTYPNDQPWLLPQDILDGELWSGLVTRETGSFEPALTSYIQALLAAWQTDDGQFTLDLDRGRVPVLRLRKRKTAPDDGTFFIDATWPGVGLSLTRDFTQRANVVFGTGRALAGNSFSGMQISPDGSKTWYEPFAARRQVHPATATNHWLDPRRMRREVALTFQEGLTAAEAQGIARGHLAEFADPGVTGTLTLTNVDPTVAGVPYPRQAIPAGSTIQIGGLFGDPDGLLFHVADQSLSEDGTWTGTIDSRFRDQLTVQEVRLRGRDSLSTVRMLTEGKNAPTVPDLLFPWSYSDGAGIMPLGGAALFKDVPGGAAAALPFPWTQITTARPPSNRQWAGCYIHIPPASGTAEKNWATFGGSGTAFKAYPVRLAAAGDIRLLQVAAYDADGNVLPVAFHLSVYYESGVSPTSMPILPADQAAGAPYAAGAHYPFFKGAFESVLDTGGTAPNGQQVTSAATMIVGYGNGYEKAGYWPAASTTTGATPTGLLVDEERFHFDFSGRTNGIDVLATPAVNQKSPDRVTAYVMVFCDEQDQDVYFLGRMFRLEPGTT